MTDTPETSLTRSVIFNSLGCQIVVGDTQKLVVTADVLSTPDGNRATVVVHRLPNRFDKPGDAYPCLFFKDKGLCIPEFQSEGYNDLLSDILNTKGTDEAGQQLLSLYYQVEQANAESFTELVDAALADMEDTATGDSNI